MEEPRATTSPICTLKLNGRLIRRQPEKSDRHDGAVIRLFVRQKDPGMPGRTFVPIVDEEQAKTLLDGIKDNDYVEIDAYVADSDEWNSSIVIEQITRLEKIDGEYLFKFALTGPLDRKTKKKLADGGKMYELEVAGVHIKVFHAAALAELQDVKQGQIVTVGGYVKSYIKEELLRSNLYVERIERVAQSAAE